MPDVIDGRTLPIPARLAHRPRDARGYLVPWFVAEVRPGVYDFRIADELKRRQAVRNGLCWTCGARLGQFKAFVVGPMCAINRTSSEPPSHRDCATYAALACPFLSRPQARRRANDLPEHEPTGGLTISRNPGVTLVWITRSFRTFRTSPADGPGVAAGWLVTMGDPVQVLAYAEGRAATTDELWASIVTGYPFLAEAARDQAGDAPQALRTHLHAALAELAGLRLVTGRQLQAIDQDMPPVQLEA